MNHNKDDMVLPLKIEIVEVGPRDGFQNEPGFIPTEIKIKIIDALSETGLKRIEVTSFVHPKAIPQLSDAAEVLSKIKRKTNVIYEALIPNMKGMERALEAGMKNIILVVSASQAHNMKNMKMSVEESLDGFREIVKVAKENNINVGGGIATAFGCVYEGKIPFEKLGFIIEEYVKMGVCEISLGDTIGAADPISIKSIVKKAYEIIGNIPIRLHLHNTRGQGLANVLSALEVGVTIFDTSICGLGGCPFSPGATGNIPTADLVNMLHSMNIETHVDLGKLIECEKMTQQLLGRDLPGQVMKSGATPWIK